MSLHLSCHKVHHASNRRTYAVGRTDIPSMLSLVSCPGDEELHFGVKRFPLTLIAGRDIAVLLTVWLLLRLR